MDQVLLWGSQALVIGIVAIFVWRLSTPNDAVRKQIESTLKARGLKVVEVTADWSRSERNRVCYVARSRNPFGNTETHRCEVGRWSAALLKSPTITEV